MLLLKQLVCQSNFQILRAVLKTMNEISLAIMDKLVSSDKKVLFVMEDVHWIDPETLTLLKHFIKTVNRNSFLRQNMCIIITVRSGKKG